MFPNFPLSMFPSSDERLNRIVAEHGGWIHLLDPNTKLDEEDSLLGDLSKAGYGSNEILALKALFSSCERETLLLRAAVLHRKTRLGLATVIDERLLSELEPSLKRMKISTAELADASEKIAPHAMKWFG
ncbi:MAG: hypothetical protein KC777_23470 [Cyanobacteria bacterium HKST-UBA02]|nr:hypothetical protein [Cyanobacteria bacterium HKST-UBA02]